MSGIKKVMELLDREENKAHIDYNKAWSRYDNAKKQVETQYKAQRKAQREWAMLLRAKRSLNEIYSDEFHFSSIKCGNSENK